jgi:hypothetical protein
MPSALTKPNKIVSSFACESAFDINDHSEVSKKKAKKLQEICQDNLFGKVVGFSHHFNFFMSLTDWR